MWKLTHIPDLSLDIGSGGYVFLIAGGYEYYLNLKKKKHGFLSFILLGLGVYILISSRFSWWRLLLILVIAFSKESFAGLAVGGVMIIDLLSKVMRYYPEIYISMAKNNWVALLLLSFSLILFMQYSVLKERDLKTNSMYFRKNGYWVFVIALYGALLFVGLKYRYSGLQNPWNIPFIDMVKEFVDKYNLILLGLWGIGLSIVWSVRENVLRRLKNGTQ